MALVDGQSPRVNTMWHGMASHLSLVEQLKPPFTLLDDIGRSCLAVVHVGGQGDRCDLISIDFIAIDESFPFLPDAFPSLLFAFPPGSPSRRGIRAGIPS